MKYFTDQAFAHLKHLLEQQALIGTRPYLVAAELYTYLRDLMQRSQAEEL